MGWPAGKPRTEREQDKHCYLPTPQEYREAIEEIQSRWSEQERRSRIVGPKYIFDDCYQPPIVPSRLLERQ